MFIGLYANKEILALDTLLFGQYKIKIVERSYARDDRSNPEIGLFDRINKKPCLKMQITG